MIAHRHITHGEFGLHPFGLDLRKGNAALDRQIDVDLRRLNPDRRWCVGDRGVDALTGAQGYYARRCDLKVGRPLDGKTAADVASTLTENDAVDLLLDGGADDVATKVDGLLVLPITFRTSLTADREGCACVA